MDVFGGGRASESRTTPLPRHPRRGAHVVLSKCMRTVRPPRMRAAGPRAGRRSSPDEAANQIEVAVAHFYFNQAVRFANILPEVPSKPSLFAPCVESSFGECISIKISSADFVTVIKCYGRFVIKSWSPFWNTSCFCSWKEGLDSALVVVPSLLRSSPPLTPWGQLGRAVAAIVPEKMYSVPATPPAQSLELRIASEHKCGLKVITL